MSRVRHDLGGGPAKPTSSKSSAGLDTSQKKKLAIAAAVLVIAGALIAYQTRIFSSPPPPIAAGPTADKGEQVNVEDPGAPMPKSNFSRKAVPAKPK